MVLATHLEVLLPDVDDLDFQGKPLELLNTQLLHGLELLLLRRQILHHLLEVLLETVEFVGSIVIFRVPVVVALQLHEEAFLLAHRRLKLRVACLVSEALDAHDSGSLLGRGVFVRCNVVTPSLRRLQVLLPQKLLVISYGLHNRSCLLLFRDAEADLAGLLPGFGGWVRSLDWLDQLRRLLLLGRLRCGDDLLLLFLIFGCRQLFFFGRPPFGWASRRSWAFSWRSSWRWLWFLFFGRVYLYFEFGRLDLWLDLDLLLVF